MSIRWICLFVLALLTGCAANLPPFNPPDAPEYPTARKLYIAKCARCHRLYDPSTYSDPQWRMWMTKMSKKAKLTPAQEQELTQYIEQVIRHPAK